MNYHKILLTLINNNDLKEFQNKLIEHSNKINCNVKTKLLISCLNLNKKIFFCELLNEDYNSIYYFKFEEIIRCIINNELFEYIEIMLKLNNFKFYFSFNNLLDLSIEINNYKVLNYCIKKNLINFEKDFYYCTIKKLVEIKNIDTVKLLINKLGSNISINHPITNDLSPINIKFLLNCDDEIFKLLLDFILKKCINYCDKFSLYIDHTINIFKFNLIYNNLTIESIRFIEICLYNSYISNNKSLFNHLRNEFEIDNKKTLIILRKYMEFSNRNILSVIFYNQKCLDTSLILYEETSKYYEFNVNKLIMNCIDYNNYIILKKLNLSELKDKINTKKIESQIILNYKYKYINDKILHILFQELNLLFNKKFTKNYIECIVSNNDKILISELINIINDFEKNVKNDLLNKIKYYINEEDISFKYKKGDIYDWYFIDWINIKIPELNILEDNIEHIKTLCKIYEPNIHFIYWYMNQENKFLDENELNELLIRLHSNFQSLSKIMVDNIDKDHILIDKIKNIMKNDNELQKKNLLYDIFDSKLTLDDLIKLENIDNEMKYIFSKHIYKSKIFNSEIFKRLIIKNKNNFVEHILNKYHNLKLTSIKLIICSIVDYKNYYLINKIGVKLIDKDKNKFYSKLLLESIKKKDFIIFEYCVNNIDKHEFNNIINYILINKLSENDSDYNNYNEYSYSYNFYIKILEYLNNNNKDIIYKKIIDNYGKFYNIMENFLKFKLNYKELDIENKFLYFKMLVEKTNKYDFEKLFKYLNLQNSDYSNFNNIVITNEDNINYLEYNLLYKHDINLIKLLHDSGLKLKFNNNILSHLFECSYFRKKNNKLINNHIIYNMINELSNIGLYNINLETLNLFLEYYDKLKFKIKLEDVKFLVETYNIEINYDSLYYSAKSNTLDIFQYLLSKNKDIDIKQNEQELLLQSCINNDIEFSKYLLEIEPNFDVSKNNDNLFNQCCNSGSLESIKWLYEIIENLNQKTKYEYSICGACYYGHLHVAKWLVKNIENIDIKVDNDYCMVNAVDNQYFEIVDWILEIEPERYVVEYNSTNDQINNFQINKELEVTQIKTVEEIIECPICYENNSNLVTCCNHQYCYECFNKYYKKNTNICCPCCRKENIELFNII